MASSPKSSLARKSVARFVRILTILAVASGAAALAGPLIYTEGSGGVPQFPATGPGTLLPAQFDGTTIVNGTLLMGAFSTNTVDWFELTDVGSGGFTVISTTSNSDVISVFSDTNLTTPIETHTGPVNFGPQVIPGDGNIVFEISTPGGTANEGEDDYSVTLNVVPEPSTLITLGLGLVGILTLGRMRKRQSQA